MLRYAFVIERQPIDLLLAPSEKAVGGPTELLSASSILLSSGSIRSAAMASNDGYESRTFTGLPDGKSASCRLESVKYSAIEPTGNAP